MKEFLENIQRLRFWFWHFEKLQIMMPFSNDFNWIKKTRAGYVLGESFDTISNMGFGSGKSPMYERVNRLYRSENICEV